MKHVPLVRPARLRDEAAARALVKNWLFCARHPSQESGFVFNARKRPNYKEMVERVARFAGALGGNLIGRCGYTSADGSMGRWLVRVAIAKTWVPRLHWSRETEMKLRGSADFLRDNTEGYVAQVVVADGVNFLDGYDGLPEGLLG